MKGINYFTKSKKVVFCYFLMLISFTLSARLSDTKSSSSFRTSYGLYSIDINNIESSLTDLKFPLDTSEYIIQNIIDFYIKKGAYEKSNTLIELCLASYKPSVWYNHIVYFKAKQLYYQKKYNGSINTINELLECNRNYLSHKILNNSFYYLGCNNYKLKDYNGALKYFKKSLQFFKVDDAHFFDTYLKIAVCNYRLGEPEKSLDYLNMGMARLEDYPDISSVQLLLTKILQLRSFIYRQQAQTSSDSIKLLQKSLADCEQSVQFINRYVKQQHFENDQLIFNNRYNYFFYKTIEACNRLYMAQPHDSLLYKAFYYAELDKSLALQRNLQKNKARQEHGVPTYKTGYVDSLQYCVFKTDEKINLNKLTQKNANAGLKLLYEQKGQLLHCIDSTVNEIEHTYPNFAIAKYKLPTPDTAFLKQLSFKKQIIQYVISDEKIYWFLVNQGKIYQGYVAYNDSIEQLIYNFAGLCGNRKKITFSDAEFYELATCGYRLYNLLIKPFEAYLNHNALLIIPDNELNLLPFEALIREPYTNTKADYAALAYMVKQFNISYAQSVAMFKHKQSKNDIVSANRNVLAFVPDYGALPKKMPPGYIALRSNMGESLYYLPGAISEVAHINDMYFTKIQNNLLANETNFKNHAKYFKVLHCAMHGVSNNENPLFSKLVFTPNADSLNDGLLNTYEIANMHLNTDLVVLSACNTGFGKINKGEGVLSITRAFFKAGCKSVLSTLWAVSDKSSSEIVPQFYSNLGNGNIKSKCLSQAKRTYLNVHEGIDAHPFFWAAYTISGNDEPLDLKQKKQVYLLVVFGIFLCTFIILLFYRKRWQKFL